MMKWPVALFEVDNWHQMEAPLPEVLVAEKKLLLFARWLARDYVSSTVMKYVGDVKRAQRFLLGLPLESLRVSFRRLPLLFRVLKKESPATTRDKKPWDRELFFQVFRGHIRRASVGDFGSDKVAYDKATVMVMMLWAFEQLFRLSELAPMPQQHAARKPYMWSDIRFYDAQGKEMGWDGMGRPVGRPTVMRTRMVPSKTDPGGFKEPVVSPFPAEWEFGSSPLAAGPALFRYMVRYPVDRSRAHEVPLFRDTRAGAGCTKRVTQGRFTSIFKKLCRSAKPEIAFSGFGIHAFRVGGMNRLMDLGATAPQICALGRWESDCWLLYARRHRSVLVELTERMVSG
jgi:hypothetical protein